ARIWTARPAPSAGADECAATGGLIVEPSIADADAGIGADAGVGAAGAGMTGGAGGIAGGAGTTGLDAEAGCGFSGRAGAFGMLVLNQSSSSPAFEAGAAGCTGAGA